MDRQDITLLKTSSMKSIMPQWQSLYDSNQDLLPFSSYEYCKREKVQYLGYLVSKMEWPVFFLFSEKVTGRPLMLAPLTYSLKRRCWQTFGNITGCAAVDFLYPSDMYEETMRTCLGMLLEYCGKIRFSRFDAGSLALKVIREQVPDLEMKGNELVNIQFGDSFDEYFAHLSKHVRQNVRTAYNRVQRDNLSVIFHSYSPTWTCPDYGKCLDVFTKRQTTAIGKSLLGLHFIKNWSIRYFKNDTFSLRDMDCTYLSELKFSKDGPVAAALFAFRDRKGDRIIVPRLAINSDYGFYSPGLILVAETIKDLQKGFVRNLDLSRGSEKYKFDMGGEPYYTYQFVLQSGKE